MLRRKLQGRLSLWASTAHAPGRCSAAEDDPAGALTQLHRALSIFGRMDAAYESSSRYGSIRRYPELLVMSMAPRWVPRGLPVTQRSSQHCTGCRPAADLE